MKPTPTKTDAAEALIVVESFLHGILSEKSSWCASANYRLLKQLNKTIKPLLIN